MRGKGRLVGRPIALYLKQRGIDTFILDKGDTLSSSVLRQADVVISGIGVGGVIKPDMIKEGVVLIDVGTSEISGTLRGDIDPSCAKKSALFTPVPGGVGPITVAMIFKNMLILSHERGRL